jgi:predicted kinase
MTDSMPFPKLLILRGPSGSGKTTTAKAVFEKATSRIALIEQDYYRFIFKQSGDGSKSNSAAIHKMIKSDVLIALEEGYNVVLEGILSPKSYDKIIEDIMAQHRGETYIYYFDISFEETVRRHATRNEDFKPEDMKEWFAVSYKSEVHTEIIITESSALEDTVSRILVQTRI